MRLNCLTIVLNGMPYIRAQHEALVSSGLDWTWHVVEGRAANVNCTKWCRKLPAALSNDGTHEFLKDASAKDNRIVHYHRPLWEGGKVQMVNEPLANCDLSGVLLQTDSDEVWTPSGLRGIAALFGDDSIGSAEFECRYFVGEGIITRGPYGNGRGEWLRAWRVFPRARFVSHEPPVLPHMGRKILKWETAQRGLVFDHYAWVQAQRVEEKCKFYGYDGGYKAWQRLQRNQSWPAVLKDFLPWVPDRSTIAVAT